MFELRLNNRKCNFCCSNVKFLGHVLTPEGIAVDPGKVHAIIDRKEPRNLKELISFIQTCSWYRRFIDRYAEIARPLTNLTKKTAVWKWGGEEKKAFMALKKALTTSPVLKQRVENMPLSIKTDASAYALGAVLLQGEGQEEHPIEYASRLLTNAERNYSTTEREALAIIWACNKFRGYIEGEEIKLLTDHKPLKWLLTLKSPTGRLARWGLQIQQYNFVIEHVPGRSNAVADMLSRLPYSDQDETNGDNFLCAFHVDMPTKTVEIREEQMKGEHLKEIITSLEKQDENSIRWINRSYL